MSVPSKTILPPVGSYRRRSARPTVDLPQPGLADEPERLAALDLSETPSTAFTSPTWRSMTMPLRIGNQTRRSSTSTSGPFDSRGPAEPRALPLVRRARG